ncbi:MAG: patatin-like phospholipase family protein [Brevinema sp.]
MFGQKNIKKKIQSKGLGLALGGGGMRGFFHLGVLKALEEDKIPVSYVAGVSIGSLVGGLFASGFNTKEISDILDDHTESLFDLIGVGSPSLKFHNKGFLTGEKIMKELNRLVDNKKIEDLPIPFVCRAIDIENFTEVIFDQGNLGFAVKASCSIPGIFSPNIVDSKDDHEHYSVLVDGGVTGSVPVGIVKERFDGVCLASNLFMYEGMDEKQLHTFNQAFNKYRPFKALPFTEPLIRSFYMNQSYITRLEYQLYKPELTVALDSSYIPSINNLQKLKISLTLDGYTQTKKIFNEL